MQELTIKRLTLRIGAEWGRGWQRDEMKLDGIIDWWTVACELFQELADGQEVGMLCIHVGAREFDTIEPLNELNWAIIYEWAVILKNLREWGTHMFDFWVMKVTNSIVSECSQFEPIFYCFPFVLPRNLSRNFFFRAVFLLKPGAQAWVFNDREKGRLCWSGHYRYIEATFDGAKPLISFDLGTSEHQVLLHPV